jgi:hypothetical protein
MNFLTGLKSSGECDSGLSLGRFLAVCPLAGHMYENGLLWHVVRRYSRCCMYGPNYVKLSRLFAVRLFSMSIPHYTALSPARPDPSWSNRHAITASIRLALTQARTATPTARDSNLGSGNHDMSRLSALAHLNDAPIHGLADVRLAYFQQRVAPSPLAPRPQTTRGNTRCSRLGPRQWQLRHVQTTYTRVPKRCAHPRPCLPICGV